MDIQATVFWLNRNISTQIDIHKRIKRVAIHKLVYFSVYLNTGNALYVCETAKPYKNIHLTDISSVKQTLGGAIKQITFVSFHINDICRDVSSNKVLFFLRSFFAKHHIYLYIIILIIIYIYIYICMTSPSSVYIHGLVSETYNKIWPK